MTQSDHLLQEERLIKLEVGQGAIHKTLSDMKELLSTSIRNEERVRTLQEKNSDQESRLRRLESTLAASKWIERVVWILVTGGVGFLLSRLKGGA